MLLTFQIYMTSHDYNLPGSIRWSYHTTFTRKTIAFRHISCLGLRAYDPRERPDC
jgi:hypothetical protein